MAASPVVEALSQMDTFEVPTAQHQLIEYFIQLDDRVADEVVKPFQEMDHGSLIFKPLQRRA